MKFTKMEGMLRVISLALAIFIVSGAQLYAGQTSKAKPIAQVYEVQGDVTVKRYTGSESVKVEKGILLGSDDIVTLQKGALVGLYFKDGGRKELKAKTEPLSSKIGDLLPESGEYERKDLTFGATRGVNISVADLGAQTFFYPQKSIIINSPPLIELVVFNDSDQAIHIPRAAINVLEKNDVLNSKKINNLALETPYSYSCEKMDRGKEYRMEIQLNIKEIPDRTIAFTSDFYVADIPDKNSASQYRTFADPIYRSFESISTDYEGKTYNFWFLKHLKFTEAKDPPVISIEIFIR